MDTKPSIQQVDNFFPEEVASKVSEFMTDYASYRYGETDNREAPPTGLVADLFHWDNRDAMSTAPNHVKLIYIILLNIYMRNTLVFGIPIRYIVCI